MFSENDNHLGYMNHHKLVMMFGAKQSGKFGFRFCGLYKLSFKRMAELTWHHHVVEWWWPSCRYTRRKLDSKLFHFTPHKLFVWLWFLCWWFGDWHHGFHAIDFIFVYFDESFALFCWWSCAVINLDLNLIVRTLFKCLFFLLYFLYVSDF
jgi:hypothetical protein